jgi:lysophospholipase L1-like esterase
MVTMKRLLTIALLALSAFVTTAQAAPLAAASPSLLLLIERLDNDERKLADWPDLARYRDDNAHLPLPAAGEKRVVFMGDSITDNWGHGTDNGSFFAGKPYINRGIGGQTTPQMLIRFRADVLALRPRAVVILAGTNDLAGNTGSSSLGMIEDNIISMAELAQANGIQVVLASLLPVNDYVDPTQTLHRPQEKIRELNTWLQAFAQSKGLVYLNYHDALLDARGALKKNLSGDGLHPNGAGYAVMEPLAEQAIEQALRH